MSKRGRFLCITWMVLGAGMAGALNAAAPDEWPYPGDIPVIEPFSVGLAGEQPADIARYLLALGATQARISPDGSRVAFRYRVTGEPQLWLVDASGGWPQQLTFGTGIRTFRWAPDGQHLLVTRDAHGNEREGYFLLSADGRRERQLLPLSDAFRQVGPFSSDGSRFLYASTQRNGRDFDIHVAHVASGETRLVYQGRFGFFPRSWQPDGQIVIVDETRGEGSNDVHLLDMSTGELTPLFQPPDPALHASYQWLPDGSGFFLVTNQDREFAGLARYSLADGRLAYLETPDVDVESVALSPDGRYLVWTTNQDGYTRLHARDRTRGEPLSPPPLPDGVYQVAFARDAAVLMIRVTGPHTPGDVYVWDVAAGGLSRAVRSNLAGLDPATYIVPESRHFAARDGLELQGFLYVPAGTGASARPPVVINVHGGPTAQARPVFTPRFQYLLSNGIAVFDVNVRGSTGFGKTYAALDNQEKRLDSVRDLVDAAGFLAADKRLDATRIAVMGGSYGGYMVNAVLGSYPDVFVAGASFVGVSDWVRALQAASPALKASDRIEYGDIREERWQAFYRENSPINNAHRIKAPLFVQHGANDPRDPVTESDRIVQAIRDRGGTVTYLRFPDEGHAVQKQANRLAMYRALMRFLEAHLTGRREPSQG